MVNYKLFIGDYKKEGTPATWTLVRQDTNKDVIKRAISDLLPEMKQGWEMYIVHGEEVHAYFRDGEWK